MDFSFLNIFKDHYQNIISILIIGILGFVSWKVFSILIRKKLENTQQIKDEAQGQRINTLLRILKNFASVTIIVVVIMLVLSELGIKIGVKPIFSRSGGQS